jgi:ADP-heptose:LPS heptosyltransferase
MLQPPRSPWKRAAFQAIAPLVRVLQGSGRVSSAELAKIRNFLVLQYESPLGSVVHATPLFEAMKRAMPDCHITVAASTIAASVLHTNSYIDRCVVTPSPFRDLSASVRAVRAVLESTPKGARCVITTIGNQRTRLVFLSLLVGSAVRVGYTLAPEFYDVPLVFEPERGQIGGNLDIVRSLGHPTPSYEPRVFFTRRDAERAAQWLAPLAAQLTAPRIVFVTQNSGGQRNQWSPTRFQQVISTLSRATRAVPIFVGTERDAAPIDELRRELPEKGISLAGKTTIAELAALLARCDLIVSLDTGTFHVARAVRLPGVVIAPAWQSPLEWLPVQSQSYSVLHGPSIRDIPPDYSIDEVSVEQVCDAAQSLLRQYPADPAQRTARVERSLSD